jgi:UDP-N-acetylglucosamine--N-acetylmuramyl-(pentapeptide) pyrophosphoryl-undecaprenol N-acetylglucosamine transferase
MRVILSGGGTGGHIYPAVAVAEALRRRLGEGVELLFVGALGKMEMEKVPALGYRIEGLPVAGLQRRLDWRNLLVPLKAWRSLRMARRVVRDFGADVVVGFGGYASAPVLRAAQSMGVPTVIQEQNSYAGLTNKMLAKKARAVCVAYEGMERFFPADRIVLTGNPLRGAFSAREKSLPSALADKDQRLSSLCEKKIPMNSLPSALADGCAPAHTTPGFSPTKAEALEYFGFTPDRPVLLVVGGSLGCRTFNEMMKRHAAEIVRDGTVQVIWQTGKFYAAEMDAFMAGLPRSARNDGATPTTGSLPSALADKDQRLSSLCEKKIPMNSLPSALADGSAEAPTPGFSPTNIWRGAFIDRMDLAYAAADLVISRSGAGTVSELSLLGKPVLFVPSPGVAEDHQTKNAMALVARDAAGICPDGEAVERAFAQAMELLGDPAKLAALSANIRPFGIADSAERVADMIIRIANNTPKTHN